MNESTEVQSLDTIVNKQTPGPVLVLAQGSSSMLRASVDTIYLSELQTIGLSPDSQEGCGQTNRLYM